ncbi:MAG TPA: sugar dehydrogenase [Paucimonas sp.]|nr:sugar dehydrogenase [Paucimonas sp.]
MHSESGTFRTCKRTDFITRAKTLVLLSALGPALLGAACSGGSEDSQPPPPSPASAPPPISGGTQAGDGVPVALSVTADMATGELATPRTLTVPRGFAIRVFARVPNARFMAVAPNGDLLVSNPGSGVVTLLRPGDGAPMRFTFASGLLKPHDIVFHVLNGTTYVYIAESHRVIRAPYASGSTEIGAIEAVVTGLPDSSSPELGGSYGHELKNIALNGNKLYVSIASTCNACISDTVSDPIRNAIYEYDADGGNRRLYARGLRNAEGIRFRPGTDELWAVVNHRDNIAYPFHRDFDGDGSDDFGKVLQRYVDGHPPDLLVRVKDGGNYGWPFCNPNPDSGIDDMPYDRDVELNADGNRLDCGKIDRATKGLPAHSAPLGMNFLQESGLPEPWRSGLAVGLHGRWNCSELNGHKVVFYPLRPDGSVGDAVDLVAGWITDAKAKQRWGRPVSVIPDGKGGLYVSDDYSGTIYQLYRP